MVVVFGVLWLAWTAFCVWLFSWLWARRGRSRLWGGTVGFLAAQAAAVVMIRVI